jgi:hypothetical protein
MVTSIGSASDTLVDARAPPGHTTASSQQPSSSRQAGIGSGVLAIERIDVIEDRTVTQI